MEGEMFFVGRIFYSCIYTVVLVSIVGTVVFIEKQLSPSFWLRNILAVMAGIGSSLASWFLVFVVGGIVYFNQSYFRSDSSMTAAIGTTQLGNLRFNLSVIDLSVLVVGIVVSIFGGYIAGKVARQNEVPYGFLVGLGFVLFSVQLEDGYFAGHQIHNLDYALIYVARFCSTVLGGCIAFFQRKHQTQASLIIKSEA